PYRVATTPFHDRGADHLAHQPFAQVPWLTDGDLSIFESGAILLHLAGLSERLAPSDPKGRTAVTEWVFAALNSVEMASLPWFLMAVTPDAQSGPIWQRWEDWLKLRLQRLEPVLAEREWLVGKFSVADILMADVLRLPDRYERLADYPACSAYLARALARPAFAKAHADQMAHFAAGDELVSALS
ncbi:MAG: glutathione S-transferase family protein, partial [Caulobacteraceae bacterium]|nr:glutathione S-transferase family protein [Caulobacteraceae bacterium]